MNTKGRPTNGIERSQSTSIIIADRYEVIEFSPSGMLICKDTHLDREVCLRKVDPRHRSIALERVQALQEIDSPYLGMVSDLIDWKNGLYVVEEKLGEPLLQNYGPQSVEAKKQFYCFCSGLAALHAQGLGHGALERQCFRAGALGVGKLMGLRFEKRCTPSEDRPALQSIIKEIRYPNPMLKDDAEWFRAEVEATLLVDRHRGLLQGPDVHVVLDSALWEHEIVHPYPSIGRFTLAYDGERFYFEQVEGEVWVNRKTVRSGESPPPSCVIRLGAPFRPLSQQLHYTFDQSHPEVR